MALPTDPKARKQIPVYRGMLRYFPNTCAAVAQLSMIASEQHGHDQLHWDPNKSSDQPDAEARHMLELAMAENGEIDFRDDDGVHWLVKKAWRALADCEQAHRNGTNIYAIDPHKIQSVESSSNLKESNSEHPDNSNLRHTGEGEAVDRSAVEHTDRCEWCLGSGRITVVEPHWYGDRIDSIECGCSVRPEPGSRHVSKR